MVGALPQVYGSDFFTGISDAFPKTGAVGVVSAMQDTLGGR